jgi:putative transcriptional regulator
MNDLDSLLFNIEFNKRLPQAGDFLVAEPFLREEYFCHAVICIIDDPTQSNTMGLVLNKPTKCLLSDLIPDISVSNNFTVFCGGPLSNDRLYYIHTMGDIIPDSKRICNGLYIGGDFRTIIDLINLKKISNNQIRFFLGYSGWDPLQLESEIKHNVWAVTNHHNNQDLLCGENDKYWHLYVKSMGDEYKGWRYHPENPQLN